jgi:hypothetical protein
LKTYLSFKSDLDQPKATVGRSAIPMVGKIE